VDVGGVGYLVHLSAVSLAQLPPQGESGTLRVFTNVRQDAIDLFGFATEEEEAVFRALIDVKGVGQGDGGELTADAIDRHIAERNAARAARNFARADENRDLLAAAGIELEDLHGETRWRRR
jgi:cysteinyl-tRNA synthetase